MNVADLQLRPTRISGPVSPLIIHVSFGLLPLFTTPKSKGSSVSEPSSRDYVASNSSLYYLLRGYSSHPAEAKNCRPRPLIFHSSSSSSSVVMSQERRTLPTKQSTHDFLKPTALTKHITYRERRHLSALKVQHMQKARMNFPSTPKKKKNIAPIRPSVLK